MNQLIEIVFMEQKKNKNFKYYFTILKVKEKSNYKQNSKLTALQGCYVQFNKWETLN